MRKYYIDNIRIICILLLFPYHTCMIYNTWGELFYITGEPNAVAGTFVSAVSSWWMPLLFVIAGISSVYALRRRTPGQYLAERRRKLLVPLISGLVLIIPVQSYIADVFYNGYAGGYFGHYGVFFTKYTYLTGQDGGFTPGHLWFIAYLMLISWLMLPLMSRFVKARRMSEIESDAKTSPEGSASKPEEGAAFEKRHNYDKFTIPVLLPIFLPIALSSLIFDIGGKSIGECACCFALGFFILGDDRVQERLMKNWLPLIGLFAMSLAIRYVWLAFTDDPGILWDVEHRMVTWFGILAFLGVGKRFFNRTNPILQYLSKAAFPLYFFHQSVLVIVGYFTLKLVDSQILQFGIIMGLSFLISLLCYEVFRRFRLTAWLFGIKYEN